MPKTTYGSALLFAGLVVLGFNGGCGGSSSSGTLAFKSPADGDTFCAKDDVNPATPAIDIKVEVKGTNVAEGTQVVLENDSTNSSDTQPIVGGVATFTVALAAGSNRLVAHTPDNKIVALPPVTVTANTTAPGVTITKPLDGTILGAADDANHDLTDGFQYNVEVRADVEDGQEVELYVNGVLQPTATVTSKKATFTAVTLPSTVGTDTVTLEARARNACGNQGTDTAKVQVLTGQPGCTIQGFNPAAVVIPSPGPGTVLNISTDGDPNTAGMQTSLLVQVTPDTGATSGLTVEIFYGSGATAKATGTTDANGLATIALSPPDGSLTISARCWDTAGNAGISQDLPVLVDTVAPDCALALAGEGGVKPSGLFNPADDVDTSTGGVQITGTLTSAASDVVGQPVTFTVNGTAVTGNPTVGAGGTASKNVTITAGDQTVAATVADRAQNTCTASQDATLVESGCAVSFTNLTSASVLNIASDSSTATGLQYGVTLDVDGACGGQPVTLASSKGGSVQQTVPTGTGAQHMTFTDYTVCSGSCQEQVTLTATVSDPAGNVTVKTVTFLADNVAPGANIGGWNPSGLACGGVVTPSQDVDGNGANGVQIDVLVGAPPDRASLSVDVTNGANTATFAPSPTTSNVVRVTLGSGTNSLVAHVVSASGNPGATSPACVINLQDIAVSFTSPTSGAILGQAAGTVAGGNLQTTISGTVNITGATVTLSVDGGSAIATSMVGQTWTAANVALAEGTRSIRADATASGGRTGNASISVQVDIIAPDQVGTLTITPTNRAKVDLSFVAPGDNSGGTGIDSYRIRYSTSAITDANFGAATPISPSPPTPQAAGTTEHIPANSLKVNTGYYFAVAAVDKAGNQALISSGGPVTLNFASTVYSMPSVGNLATGPEFGSSVAVGYLNSDAYPDLVIGAVNASFASASSAEGAVLVYLGTANGPHSTPDFVIKGGTGAWLGQSVAILDFDGDGIQDLAIGAPGSNSFGGAVYLCRGGSRFAQPASPPTVINPATCELTITHSSPSFNVLGWALARANFDGDASDDLVIGAPGTNGFVGEAFVLFGVHPMPATSTVALPADVAVASPVYRAWQLDFTGAPGNAQFGNYVYDVGKLEGSSDTTDEVGVAGVGQDRAYVYTGRSQPATAAITITTSGSGVLALVGASGSGVGTGMAGIGDTDGDGRREIAVGAPNDAGNNGRVFLVNGGAHDSGNPGQLTLLTAPLSSVPTVISGVSGEKLGQSLANPAPRGLTGDLNGDGLVDLWCGNSTSPWSAYIFYGGPTGLGASLTTAGATWTFSPASGDAAYPLLVFLPDLNGDGLPDLAGADYNSSTQSVTVLK